MATKAKSTKAKSSALTLDDIREVVNGLKSDTGDGVMIMGDGDSLGVKIRGVISTQCATLDAALGRGGVPLGRLTILHGSEGSGKTTVALHLVSEVQKMGGIAVYLDKEYKLDIGYAKDIGVDVDSMIMKQPSTLEETFQFIDATIKHAAKLREKKGRRVPILVVLDSMNAAITKAQFEGDWDQKHMAPQARVYSQCLPKLMPNVFKEDVALVFVSQVRKKMVDFGDDKDIAGGNAPRFYAAVIMDIVAKGKMKHGSDDPYATRTGARIKKNQVAPPFKTAEFVIKYGHGIDNERSIIDQGIEFDILTKKGSFIYWGEDKLGQGAENAAQHLRDNPDVRKKLIAATKEKM